MGEIDFSKAVIDENKKNKIYPTEMHVSHYQEDFQGAGILSDLNPYETPFHNIMFYNAIYMRNRVTEKAQKDLSAAVKKELHENMVAMMLNGYKEDNNDYFADKLKKMYEEEDEIKNKATLLEQVQGFHDDIKAR